MPTKKKRVGFIPREGVMRIIEKLSIENNLSNSKIISILVEEALSVRGIFNKETGQIDNLDFTPSDECIDLQYFSPEEILQRNDMFQNVQMLAKLILESKS